MILRKILTELQVHHSSFYFFSRGFSSSFVDHIFSLFQMFSHAGAPLNHPLLAIHLFWSTKDISEDLCLHYQSAQAISRLLSHSSHLNLTSAISFSSKSFNIVSFEWALTHRSFPRILPDSSNLSGAILKFFQSLT